MCGTGGAGRRLVVGQGRGCEGAGDVRRLAVVELLWLSSSTKVEENKRGKRGKRGMQLKEVRVANASARGSYDRPPDMTAHVRELMGTPKTKESFRALVLAAPRALARSHGRVEITLGSPISLAACSKASGCGQQGGGGGREGKRAAEEGVVRELAAAVTEQFMRHSAVPPGALTAAVMLLMRDHRPGVSLPVPNIKHARSSLHHRTALTAATPPATTTH